MENSEVLKLFESLEKEISKLCKGAERKLEIYKNMRGGDMGALIISQTLFQLAGGRRSKVLIETLYKIQNYKETPDEPR